MKDKRKARGVSATPKKNATAARVELERVNFKKLILTNPNYFGTMPKLGFSAVKVMSQKTTYEELSCLGLQPEGNRLEAVVNIKRRSGYGGDTCSKGSVEYVRFFVKRPAPEGWHDLGVATFTAHDLPAASPLPVSYSVEIDMDEPRKYCSVENIVEVRAILSWNLEPAAGDPGWKPPWGSVLDVRVQVAPRSPLGIPFATLIEDKLVSIDPSILKSINLQETIKSVAELPEPTYAALKKKYADKDVPAHRFGFTHVQKLLAKPLSATVLAKLAPKPPKKGEVQGALAAGAGIDAALVPDFESLFASLAETKGDTTYEQLDCAGYNPETRMLNGVIRVKRTSGYSGDLCDPGSTEYVGFWVRHGGAWHSLGSAQVRVHDLAGVSPDKPVHFAVFRGANLPEHLCEDITGLPLRAILSWQHPPTGPDYDPVWGNVVDTHIQPVITDVPLGEKGVRLMRVNRVTTTKIDASGFAQASDIAGDCTNGNDSPFGGDLFIEGDLTLKSDAYFDPHTGAILLGQHPPAYQVWVHRAGSPAAPAQLTNSFKIAVFPVDPLPGQPAVTTVQAVQTFGGAEYYLYREGIIQAVNPRMLAVWESGGLEEGPYDIELRGFVWTGGTYVPLPIPSQTQRVYVYNGYPHTELTADGQPFTIRRPQLALSIDPPVGDCGDVTVGDTITGQYSVMDNFFSRLSLFVEPITIGGIPQPINPLTSSGPTLYPAVGTNGASGTWELKTAGMTPCGYTVILDSRDRAMVSNSCLGHYNRVGVGFCLRKK